MYPTNDLVVCYGMGQDSTGMLMGLLERDTRPWKVIFADVGSERRETYAFLPEIQDWLLREGFPPLDVVKYVPRNFKHWPKYYTLLENCLTNVTLPSISYGFHTCSAKWKISPINSFLKYNPWAQRIWVQGKKLRKAIGFDDSPYERQRAERGCATFAFQTDEKDKYDLIFPLQEWHWTRQDCIDAIKRHGLTVPVKSSCYFCAAMKPAEVKTLDEQELKIIVILEARVHPRHLAYAEQRGWPKGVGVPLIHGLWRSPVKGMRGATPRPGSMTEYIRQEGLLPKDEIQRLQAATSSALFCRLDFESMGFDSWQDWLESIIYPPQQYTFAADGQGVLL